MIILDGQLMARRIEEHIRDVTEEHAVSLSLASLFVGNAADSALYTRRKAEAAERLGVTFDVVRLDANAPAAAVAREIEALNSKPKLNGYIMQLPLPDHLRYDTGHLLNMIDPKRDVDGLTDANRQRFLRKDRGAFPPTPVYAVLNMLASVYPETRWEKQLQFMTNKLPKLVPTELKDELAVIISDGDVFGQTLEAVLKEGGMQAMVVKSDVMTLERTLRDAKVVITAVGKPGFLRGDMIQEGAIVIDVGTTLVDGKTRGDADWKSVSQKAGAATPVPGGVGPVTVAMLYANLLNLKLHPRH